MPRQRKWPPPISHCYRDGVDRVRIYGIDGRARRITLGPTGSEEAKSAYRKLIKAEEEARLKAEGQQPAAPPPTGRTVAEVLARYTEEMVNRRERLGKLSSSQAKRVKRALRPVVVRFGDLDADQFTVGNLEEVRGILLVSRGCRNCKVLKEKAAAAGEPAPTCLRCQTRPGLNRKYVNALVRCIVRAFRWGSRRKIIPATVHAELATLEGLRHGDEGRDSDEVLPADMDDVERVVPLLPAPLAAVVRLQVLTGARPNELLRLTPADLNRSGKVVIKPGQTVDTAGKVWSLSPAEHKNAWRGHSRLILFGPTAQAILQPFLEGRKPDAFLFSPREAVAALHARQRANRKTPVQPSQVQRARDQAARPKRKAPGEKYTPGSYRQAVQRVCDRLGIQRFFPYQLRHNAGTWLVDEYGWELARIVLGHKSIDVTRIYAADSVGKAAEAIGTSG